MHQTDLSNQDISIDTADFHRQGLGFNPRAVCVGLVMGNLELGQKFFTVSQLFPLSINSVDLYDRQ